MKSFFSFALPKTLYCVFLGQSLMIAAIPNIIGRLCISFAKVTVCCFPVSLFDFCITSTTRL